MTTSTPGFRRGPRIADQMTPALHQCLSSSEAAQRAGDIPSALEWYRAVPLFQRSRHLNMLELLDSLDGTMPEWVWARWIGYQTTRCNDGEAGQLNRFAQAVAIESVHRERFRKCYLEGGDPLKTSAVMVGESWVLHQYASYEVKAMAAFIEEHATGLLAEHCDLATRWSEASMGGFQIGESIAGTRLRVRAAGSERWTEVLDLGARSGARTADPDDPHWVIGRLVPSGVGELQMFDRAPLTVPERIAVAVAGGDGWVSALQDALDDGTLTDADLCHEDYELATDVRELDLLRFGTAPRDRDRVLQELRSGKDEIRRAAFRVMTKAISGDIAEADQAYVAAAALNPRAASDAVRRRPAGTEADAAILRWADRTPSPSADRLRALVA